MAHDGDVEPVLEPHSLFAHLVTSIELILFSARIIFERQRKALLAARRGAVTGCPKVAMGIAIERNRLNHDNTMAHMD